MFFIIEEVKKTNLNITKGTVKKYCAFILL